MRMRSCGAVLSAVLLCLPAGLCGCFCGQFFRQSEDVVSLTIAPANGTIQPGATQQFTGSGTSGTGGTLDVSSQVVWTSSDPAIATISNTGLATGLAVGSVTIAGSCQCYTSKTSLAISTQTATVTSIAVTPANPTISAGGTQSFVATATYSNNTSGVITNVTWTSSNGSVATVSDTGIATGSAAGSTTIKATSGTVSGSTTLVVK